MERKNDTAEFNAVRDFTIHIGKVSAGKLFYVKRITEREQQVSESREIVIKEGEYGGTSLNIAYTRNGRCHFA
jgi:hypothetical protein